MTSPSILKRRLFVVLSLLTFAGVIVACQVVAGIERVDKSDLPVPLPEAEPAPPTPDPCPHSVPPGPPLTDDRPNLDDQLDPFFLAFREVHLLGRNDAGAAQGFDLDGVCTCDTSPGSAFDGGQSCRGPRSCDGEGGIDNGQLNVFDVFGSFLPNGEDIDEAAGVNEHIAQGIQGMLLYISDYNGLKDDKSVSVGFILSHGIRDSSGCGLTIDASAPPYPPGWCGNDKWSVDPDGVLGKVGMYAPTLAGKGYVSDWQLVVSDERGFFQVPFGNVSVAIYSPLVVATIVPLDSAGNPRGPTTVPSGKSDRNYRMENGVLSGRVPASSMVAVAGALVAPGANDGGTQYLCQTSVFGTVKSSLCGAVDIASSKNADFDPQAICDAISTSSTFRADPAAAGEVYRPSDFLNACVLSDDAGVLADLYRCPTDAGP